ncbi:MAG: hypothetical protein NC307_00580 [Roseburia sp.]|nr:hypothetical protein [Roseburia sp.]
MKNKKYRMMCGLVLGTFMLAAGAGCGSASSEKAEAVKVSEETAAFDNAFVYEDEEKEVPVSTTVMGKVVSVSGATVELEVADFHEGEGGMPQGGQPGGERPEGEPQGNAPSGGMPQDMPQGEKAVLTLGDSSVVNGEITQGTMISITFDEDGAITKIEVQENMGGGMAPGGQASAVDSYDAVTEYSEDTQAAGEQYASTGTDENAILVTGGASVTLDSIGVERNSSDSTGGDTASFYGVGAAVLATDGELNISDSSITTDSQGGAGVFAYGDGKVNVSTTKIDTSQDTSGGIHVAGGGTLYANNLEVATEGNSSAAIRSDRGGGTMFVTGGSYTSSGTGSPAVYCTADIMVNGANLTATGSEAVCMEGLNNLYFYNCNITGNMKDDDQNDTTWNMIVYQSMSGDAQVGNATMQIQGGRITAENGGLIYTTNTQSNILLSGVDIAYADDSEFFLQCTGNNNKRGWGKTGENGADCTFTALGQEMEGNIIWDSISNLKFYMEQGSTLTGAFLQDETWAGNGGDGFADLCISEDSTWVVTGDSTLTNLYNAGDIVDAEGKAVSVKGADGTVYAEGDSVYAITVESYSTDPDFSGAASPQDEKKLFTE